MTLHFYIIVFFSPMAASEQCESSGDGEVQSQRSGVLVKKGNKLPCISHRRYYSLKDGNFICFQNKKCAKGNMSKKFIPVNELEVEAYGQNSFVIKPNHGPKWTLSAETPNERDKWIQSIIQAQKSIRNETIPQEPESITKTAVESDSNFSRRLSTNDNINKYYGQQMKGSDDIKLMIDQEINEWQNYLKEQAKITTIIQDLANVNREMVLKFHEKCALQSQQLMQARKHLAQLKILKVHVCGKSESFELSEIDDKSSSVTNSELSASTSCDIEQEMIEKTKVANVSKSVKSFTSKIRRRETIPPKQKKNLGIGPIFKNIGTTDINRISLPVNINEPLSMLQRFCEDFEYSCLLDKAVNLVDRTEQMCYVAAFAITAWEQSNTRMDKPFNPLLGETFACDRRDDYGWRVFSEQVSHHPPISAQYVEGRKWTAHENFGCNVTLKINCIKLDWIQGATHIVLTDIRGEKINYAWDKCSIDSKVLGVLIGKKRLEHQGEFWVTNYTSQEKCQLSFQGGSRKVNGDVYDRNGRICWKIDGFYDKCLNIAKVSHSNDEVKERKWLNIWNANPPYYKTNADKYYNFTKLAVQLNEFEDGLIRTDSRYRPDLKNFENGFWDKANLQKKELEQRQRAAENDGKPHEPIWFHQTVDPTTGVVMWRVKINYWNCIKTNQWPSIPEIFEL